MPVEPGLCTYLHFRNGVQKIRLGALQKTRKVGPQHMIALGNLSFTSDRKCCIETQAPALICVFVAAHRYLHKPLVFLVNSWVEPSPTVEQPRASNTEKFDFFNPLSGS